MHWNTESFDSAMEDTTSLSNRKRALVEKYVRGMGLPGSETIRRRVSGNVVPLSVSQEELFRRGLRVPGIPPLYNECITVRMKGALDVVALERSFNEIIKRHEAWRTTFETKAGQPVQIIHAPVPVSVPVVDLRDLPEAKREAAALRLAGEDAHRPFDMSRGPLLRPKLVRIDATEHKLFLIAHQIILDGVSAYQIFPSELATFYQGFSAGKPVTLPELPVQFADFACWQREGLNSATGNQLDYWRRQLGGELPALAWPAKPRPATRTFRGSIQSFSFGVPLSGRIKQLARQLSTTLFLVLAAGLATLLHRYTNQEEIVLGTLSPSGRKRSEVMGLLGYFLNPVALRLRLREGMTFPELLLSAKAVLLEAMCHDDVPIERVAQELGVSDNVSPSPFFTAAISLQPPMPNLDLPWSVTTMDVESGGSPWDFYLAFIDMPEGLIGRAQFNPELLDKTTIECMLQDLQEVLASASPQSIVMSAGVRADGEGAAGAAGPKRSAV
jgi:hypothetical protein